MSPRASRRTGHEPLGASGLPSIKHSGHADIPIVSTTLEFLTTHLRRVHFRSSLGRSPARVCSRAFSTNAHYHGSLPQRLGGGLRPALESRSRGTFPHLSRSLFHTVD